ncbi:hypothetical protein BH09BAC5_BH09BAC5_17510 [soil metagenome]
MCHLSLTLFCQAFIGKRWTIECGASKSAVFKGSPSLNLRYISPRFKWSNYEMNAEDEKHPEKFKNTRVMLELIYAPPLKVLATSLNVQYSFLRNKRLSLEAYGGLKFILAAPPGYFIYPSFNTQKWYMNIGLLGQLNLGIISPFAEIGGDYIITVGTELNFHSIYRKPKKKYKLHLLKKDKQI